MGRGACWGTGDEKVTGVGAGGLGHLHHTPRPSRVGGREASLSRSAASHTARATCFVVLALAFSRPIVLVSKNDARQP